MDPKKLYLYALDVATKVVERVGLEQMELATPDTEWNVHDLLQHIIYELAWTADIVAGKTIEEVGDKYEGELLVGNPVQAWRHYEVMARVAVEECDVETTAHLSYAVMPVSEYLFDAGIDQLIHAWDLGQAIGVPVVFDVSMAQGVYDRVSPKKDQLVVSGLFAAPVAVPDDATVQVKLLAIMGRSESWSDKN